MHLQPNTLLQGRYRVARLLAQGGMGAVYEAVDERLGNTVALKQTLVSDLQLQAAFAREARLLAGLHHPALPVVSDHFAEHGDQFLVMQFIPGDDLGAMLQRRGAPFPLAEVLPWADRLLDALDVLHSRRPPIIHRDIKPQNLKLTARGELVLLDFGLAKGEVAPGGAGVSRSIFGYTPQYAPLEQIQGSGTAPGSDLYAAGATLYELLTGAPPPDALTRAAAAVSAQPDPLRPAHALNPALPPALSALLAEAMALDPARRPPSAAAMRAALRALDGPGASYATKPLPPSHPPTSAGRPTIAVAGAGSAGRPTIAPGDPGSASQPTINLGASTVARTRRPLPPVPPRRGLELADIFNRHTVWLWVVVLVLVAGVWALQLPGPGIPAVVGPDQILQGVELGGEQGGSGTTGPGREGATRAAPLPPNAVARIDGWELRLLGHVRGDEAWRRLFAANQFNDPPPAGHEYVLLRLAVRATFDGQTPRQLFPELTGDRLLEYAPGQVPPDPALETELAGGQSSEGWLPFLVAAGEQNLLIKVAELPSPPGAAPAFLAVDPGAAVAPDPSLELVVPNKAGADHREPAAPGETAVMEDWEVTLREVARGQAALERLEAVYDGYKRPADGREYVLCYVELRSIRAPAGPDDARLVDNSLFASVSTRAADPEAEEWGRPPVYLLPAPELDFYAYPGASVAGWVAIEVPAGARDVALVFSDGFARSELNTRYFALE